MYLPNLLEKVQNEFAPDKKFNFRVKFPNMDYGYQYSGSGSEGPGWDPCPYLTWFPATSVDVPVGWFVNENIMNYYMIQVPVPEKVIFQKIRLGISLDRYKKLESWFERWYETMVNGGKHVGTLREVARPFQVIKTYSNPLQALNRNDPTRGFNYTTYFVVPSGQMTDMLEYKTGAKEINIEFNIVGKIADTRAMERPKNQF